MSAADRDQALEGYRRIRREVADSQVLDDAEDVLDEARVQHLEMMRNYAVELVSASLEAMQNARTRQEMRHAKYDCANNLLVARNALISVQNELDAMCRQVADRATDRRIDLERLRRAWNAVQEADREAAAGIEAAGIE